MTRHATHLIAALVIITLIAPSSLADSITMRASVRLPEHITDVQLHHIADLDGPAALAFSELAIATLPPGEELMRLAISDVRAKLTEAGAHWGRINLNGRQTIVRARHDARVSPPQAMSAVAIKTTRGTGATGTTTARSTTTDEPDMLAKSLINTPTARGEVARRLSQQLSVTPDRLRLRFSPPDAAWLDADRADQRIEIAPLSRFDSDRVNLDVRLWSDGVMVERVSITVHAEMLANQLIARRSLSRTTRITPEDVEVVEAWIRPGANDLQCTLDDAVGRITTTALKAGDTLLKRHVRNETVVKRGDLVKVRCLVGGVAISMDAVARGNGGVGDTVTLQKQGERATFLAEIVGRGEAVVRMNG